MPIPPNTLDEMRRDLARLSVVREQIAVPDSLRDSPTAEAFEAIVNLDLMALGDIEPLRGYGRD